MANRFRTTENWSQASHLIFAIWRYSTLWQWNPQLRSLFHSFLYIRQQKLKYASDRIEKLRVTRLSIDHYTEPKHVFLLDQSRKRSHYLFFKKLLVWDQFSIDIRGMAFVRIDVLTDHNINVLVKFFFLWLFRIIWEVNGLFCPIPENLSLYPAVKLLFGYKEHISE